MKTSRRALIVSPLLLAACATGPPDYAVKEAANATDTADFTVTAEPGHWRKDSVVQGYIYNKRALAASRIRLRVDSLDATGKVVASDVRPVDQDIPANDRIFYQVPTPGPAPTYRAQVDYVFWHFGDGGAAGGAM